MNCNQANWQRGAIFQSDFSSREVHLFLFFKFHRLEVECEELRSELAQKNAEMESVRKTAEEIRVAAKDRESHLEEINAQV